MATLIPSIGTCTSRMTSGERRLAQRLEQKLKNQNKLNGKTISEKLQDAVSKNIIQPQDVPRLLEYDARRFDCILTDAFDKL